MTSGMRHIVSEAVLWLCVFIIAFAAFFYLDGRIGAYIEQDDGQQPTEFVEHQQAEAETQSETQTEAEGPDQENSDFGRVTLHAGRTGHFEVTAYINDSSITLLADTGATYVVLTYEDAQTLGLTHDLDFTGRARTANGVSKVAPLMLASIEVGDIQIENVQAVVAQEGKLANSLLGMSFIARLDRFEMSGRKLVLIK